jgi:hypothetical protein
MNIFAKLPVKKIIMVLIGIFYLYIIVSNLLANTEGLDTMDSETMDSEPTDSSSTTTPEVSSKNKNKTSKLEEEGTTEVLEDENE